MTYTGSKTQRPLWCPHDPKLAWEVEVFFIGPSCWKTLRVCGPCLYGLKKARFETRNARAL